MEKRTISQEGLKLIACMTMLADHIGAVFFPGSVLRVIGRLAFPIYCYLLTEGVLHTKDRRKYGQRLLIGIFLAELPYDFLFYGGWYWGKQNVMLSLFLGYLYCVAALGVSNPGFRIALMMPFAFLAELLNVDYGCWGILMIGMFLLTKNQPRERLLQFLLLVPISWLLSEATVTIGALQLRLQLFAVLAMIPIALYDGTKRTGSLWIRRMFYLFYPAHLALLYLMKVL